VVRIDDVVSNFVLARELLDIEVGVDRLVG
jgi:hypothetical protein